MREHLMKSMIRPSAMRRLLPNRQGPTAVAARAAKFSNRDSRITTQTTLVKEETRMTRTRKVSSC